MHRVYDTLVVVLVVIAVVALELVGVLVAFSSSSSI